MYDFLIVGSGIAGAVAAEQLTRQNKSVMIVEKRSHIAGNCYTEKKYNIDIHKFGPHIFNTNNKDIWNYVNQFAKFNNYKHIIKASYHNRLYSFPINLKTFEEVYGIKTQKEAEDHLKSILCDCRGDNIEDWCLANIGPELYRIFVKNYTEKQWNKPAKELPSSIIKRIPVRTTYDDHYFNSQYYGIPVDGYTEMVKNIIGDVQIELGVDFFNLDWQKYAKNLIYCGPIDQFFNYTFGKLDYRSLRWENKEIEGTFQSHAIINYTDETPYTRIVEHKHFNDKNQEKTIISYEYPTDYNLTNDPYYPINDIKNNTIYKQYKKLGEQNNIWFLGRQATYAYIDMDSAILMAINLVKKICN